MKILVVNGPNLNLLGIREPEVYGKATYEDLVSTIQEAYMDKNIDLDFFQSNSEGDIIDKLHKARTDFDGVVINPGAYTHYSYAIHDAIKAIMIPVVEVHISNIHGREAFRSHSVTASACIGQISGLGFYGYILAVDALLNNIRDKK